MSKLHQILLGAALVTVPFGLSAARVYALTPGDPLTSLGEVNEKADLGDQDLEDTLGTLISVFLGLLGIIFLVLVIYAGFLWMTAGGDDKKVGQAKQILITSVIGLVILLSAYAISKFVIEQLTLATGSG